MSAYIVQRMDNNVYIREVDPDSCAFTLVKREAWNHAQLLAEERKKIRRPAAKNITFIDINGKRKVVA